VSARLKYVSAFAAFGSVVRSAISPFLPDAAGTPATGQMGLKCGMEPVIAMPLIEEGTSSSFADWLFGLASQNL
jgi:hypothetical protein